MARCTSESVRHKRKYVELGMCPKLQGERVLSGVADEGRTVVLFELLSSLSVVFGCRWMSDA